MRYLGISVIGVALFGMALSGAVLAQTAGGTSSAGSTPGIAGSVRPGTLPSTAPAQTLRSTTGVIQNQQMLDRISLRPFSPTAQPPSPVTCRPEWSQFHSKEAVALALVVGVV